MNKVLSRARVVFGLIKSCEEKYRRFVVTLELEFNWPKLLKKSQFFFVDQKKTRESEKKRKTTDTEETRARERNAHRHQRRDSLCVAS